jgi:hypothetical protein
MDKRLEQADFFLTQMLEISATVMYFHYKMTFLPHKRERDVMTSPISNGLNYFDFFFFE